MGAQSQPTCDVVIQIVEAGDLQHPWARGRTWAVPGDQWLRCWGYEHGLHRDSATPRRSLYDGDQLAIVSLDGGTRLTVRILGARVKIGDKVELAETRDGIEFFRLAS